LAGGEDVEPFSLRQALPIAAEKLEPLVGKYKLKIGGVADVTREGDRLFVQLTGQPRIGLYATSDTKFYCRPVDAKFDFEADESGRFDKMVIHQNGLDIAGERVGEEEKPAGDPAAALEKETPAD
jgi:serine-type D-Ala-D-Ala carboxypeptidase/endopeptidase